MISCLLENGVIMCFFRTRLGAFNQKRNPRYCNCVEKQLYNKSTASKWAKFKNLKKINEKYNPNVRKSISGSWQVLRLSILVLRFHRIHS